MISEFLSLHRNGVMGINHRNITLVNRYNSRKNMKLVNDKTITKQLAEEAGIPTPRLYGVVRTTRECQSVAQFVDREKGAVIKPACGSQGKGVLVINAAEADRWKLSSDRVVSDDYLVYHSADILSGMFSLSGQPDVAMVEERVEFDNVFQDVTYKGVPDIRIIVLKGVPIAGMLRLPTSHSDGKANLHRGGVGCGINLATGLTMTGITGKTRVEFHPDTGKQLKGLEVPYWETILDMSARAYEVTGLGYLGSDIVLDRNRGPLMLELNARPGLSIQKAIGCGLLPFIRQIEAIDTQNMSPEERVTLGRSIWRDRS